MKPEAISRAVGLFGEQSRVWKGAAIDLCSKRGAELIKARLEAYWRERGFDVGVLIRDAGFHPAIRAARFDVRSDMLNGLPRACVRQPEQFASDDVQARGLSSHEH